MFDLARMDLERRLSKKFEISTNAKAERRTILWERPIDCQTYQVFKEAYNKFEKDLQPWLDVQRWLHKVDFSDCWLAFEVSERGYKCSAKFVIYKAT